MSKQNNKVPVFQYNIDYWNGLKYVHNTDPTKRHMLLFEGDFRSGGDTKIELKSLQTDSKIKQHLINKFGEAKIKELINYLIVENVLETDFIPPTGSILNLKQGEIVEFEFYGRNFVGTVCGKSTTPMPVIGEGVILECSIPGNPYSHIVVMESQLRRAF